MLIGCMILNKKKQNQHGTCHTAVFDGHRVNRLGGAELQKNNWKGCIRASLAIGLSHNFNKWVDMQSDF